MLRQTDVRPGPVRRTGRPGRPRPGGAARTPSGPARGRPWLTWTWATVRRPAEPGPVARTGPGSPGRRNSPPAAPPAGAGRRPGRGSGRAARRSRRGRRPPGGSSPTRQSGASPSTTRMLYAANRARFSRRKRELRRGPLDRHDLRARERPGQVDRDPAQARADVPDRPVGRARETGPGRRPGRPRGSGGPAPTSGPGEGRSSGIGDRAGRAIEATGRARSGVRRIRKLRSVERPAEQVGERRARVTRSSAAQVSQTQAS